MRTHHQSTRLTGHKDFVHSVAFRADGRLLASCGSDRTVRVWDVAAAKCVAVLNGHTDEVFSAVFHPDGTRLASGGRDRAVWLWDLATGQEVARLEGHTNYIYSLAFSPDGTSLVSGSGDGTVRIWDTEPPAAAATGPPRGRDPASRGRAPGRGVVPGKEGCGRGGCRRAGGSVTQRAPAESGLTRRDENVCAKSRTGNPLRLNRG